MGRLRGFLWLVAGLIVAAVAALVAFTALSRATAQRAGQQVVGPQVPVVVAARNVAVGTQLQAADLQTKSVPVEAAPEGAIGDPTAATGKLTSVDLYPGEILLSQRLVDPNLVSGDGKKAVLISGEDVLMAIPADDLMSRTGTLKAGDHVDLLFTLDFPAATPPPPAAGAGAAGAVAQGGGQETVKTTFNLLQNLSIAAVVTGQQQTAGSQSADAIFFTVSPQDALVLKYVKDAGAVMDVVVRAPGNDVPATAEPVDFDYVINRYQIPAGAGR
jgi:Flp pilus assembly protein CpaB